MEENFIICKISQTESNNVELTNQLTNIINRAFRKTESDMWEKRIKRTNIQDVSHYIYDEEMVCVYKKSKQVGCMWIQRVTKEIAENIMLTVEVEEQGAEVWKSIIQYGEEKQISQGYNIVQIELLKPKMYTDQSRENLQLWYERLGYNQVGEQALECVLPELAPGLKVPSKFTILHKNT